MTGPYSADKSPDRIFGSKPLEPAGTTPQTPKDFQPYMRGSPATIPGQAPTPPSGPTPMDLAQGPPQPNTIPSIATILSQAKTTQDTLGTVHKQLNTQNLKLRRSQAHLIKNKLTDAQGYLRQAGAKLGVELPPMQVPSGTSALGRFVAYVNDGQNQLIEVQQKLKNMAAAGQHISAAEMLSVTVKMNLAQQEIEYSSTLLAKVIQSITQIMQIQL